MENKTGIKNLIAVPCFNNLEYTKKLLNTISLQKEDALFLINNGSSDETITFLSELQSRGNLFVLNLSENAGVAGAWNTALKLAFEDLNCDNVIFLGNDTLLNPLTLKRIKEDLAMPDVGLVSAFNITKKCADEREFFETAGTSDDNYIEAPDFSCFGMNKNCFKKVGFFDEAFYPAYYEDNDYHYRMKLEKIKALCNQGNFYWHYGSRTKQQSPEFGEYVGYRYEKNEEYYCQKWGGLPGEETYVIPFYGRVPEMIKVVTFEEYQKMGL